MSDRSSQGQGDGSGPEAQMRSTGLEKFLSAWLPWGIFVAALAVVWPTRVVVRSDDFGYIESVAETIRHGTLRASNWLEPLNFIQPLLSAGLWRVGGSFYAATLGLSALVALINFGLLGRWLRPLLPGGMIGGVVWLAIGLCPVVLNKTVEFTGVPLGWTFFLGALLAWRARSPWWFFGLVFIGFLNRQSAAFLLVLPAVEQGRIWRRGERMQWRWLAGGAGVTALVLAVMVTTPATFARALAAQNQAGKDYGMMVQQVFLGAGLLGGIAAMWSWARGEREKLSEGKLTARFGPVLGWLVVGLIAMSSGGQSLRCETPLLWRYGPVVVLAAIVAAATTPRAWLRVSAEEGVAAAVFGLLVAWRGVWWDYYLCEPALLLACAVRSPMKEAATADGRRLQWCTGAALLAVALLWVYPLWRGLRWAETRVVAYEQALRAGTIEVSAASGAPFGLLGWKVFPASVQRGVTPGLRLSSFLKYVDAVGSDYVRGAVVPLQLDVERRSLDPSRELWPLPPGYRPRMFPLSDEEWGAWLTKADR